MRRSLLCLAAAWAAACGAPASDVPHAPESAPLATAQQDSAAGAASAWPDAAGPFLALATSTAGEALLFRRDTTVAPAQPGVVGYDSVVTAATIRDVRALPCAARAVLRLTDAPAGWSLALDTAYAHPVMIDALEDLSPADSQQLVVRIQRALNTLPDTGGELEFRGLPVVVRDAWVVHLKGQRLVVARAARMRNLEAAAHEELRLVVLENDQPRYVARVAGDEETVESWDLLATLMIRGQPWLAVAREGTRSLQLELVARDSAGWHSAWRSDALACGNPK